MSGRIGFCQKSPWYSFLFHIPERISSLKIFIFFLLLFCGFVGGKSPALAQEMASQESKPAVKVAILPVTIYSPEKLDYLREGLWDMLSSRIELSGRVAVVEKGTVKKALQSITGEMNAEKAKEVGRSLGADFVVFGSMTKLGDSSSLDLRIVDVTGEKSPSPVYVKTKKMEEIIAQVDDLARKVDENILGYSLRPAVAEKAAAPAAAPAPPTKAPREAVVVPAVIPGLRPMRSRGTQAGATFGEFFQTLPFSFQVKGMSIGDLDGDGRNEVAMISDRDLWIYRWENNQFKMLQKIEGSRLANHLAVDAADMDGDGKEEIYVTSLPQRASTEENRLTSFVVAYKDGRFQTVASNLDWFLRVVDWGKKKVLLGQRKAYQGLFEDAIYEMRWDGKTLKQMGRAKTPKGCNVFGLAPFEYQGQMYFAFLDNMNRLKVADSKGKFLWRGQVTYGSNNSFQAKPGMKGDAYYEGDEMAFVNVRLISQGNEILLIRNLSPVGDLFKRQKVFSGAEIQDLVWNGAMFMEKWKSPEIPGYGADIQIGDFNGDRTRDLVVAVNLAGESIFSGGGGSALMISRMSGTS